MYYLHPLEKMASPGTDTGILKKIPDQRNIASFLLSLSRCATCPEKEIETFLSDLCDESSSNQGYCLPGITMGVIGFWLKMTRKRLIHVINMVHLEAVRRRPLAAPAHRHTVILC